MLKFFFFSLSLQFFNDLRFKSRIIRIGQAVSNNAYTSTEPIRSSSNTMLIGYWSSAGHRGFKLRYTAQVPARKFQNLLPAIIYSSCILTMKFNVHQRVSYFSRLWLCEISRVLLTSDQLVLMCCPQPAVMYCGKAKVT